ncbi:hypothetical protein SFIMM107S_04288 [Streptomyces griseus]
MAQDPEVSVRTVNPLAARAFTVSGSAKNSAFSDPITPRTVFAAVPLSPLSRPRATAAATPAISTTARTIPTMRLTLRSVLAETHIPGRVGWTADEGAIPERNGPGR